MWPVSWSQAFCMQVPGNDVWDPAFDGIEKKEQ